MNANSDKSEFAVTGMHCQACVTKIQSALSAISGVANAHVTLNPPRARVTRKSSVSNVDLRRAIQSAGDYDLALPDASAVEHEAETTSPSPENEPQESLYPLLLIVSFIAAVTLLIAIRSGNFDWTEMMGNFMAGFFIVFGFFKLLDPRGFVDTYRTYDLLAKAVSPWAWAYPFVEVGLGAAYLLKIAPLLTNLATLVIMLIGALGVGRALMNKQRIRCACLGTALNLPMTTITLVEDLGMAAMAGAMLLAIVT